MVDTRYRLPPGTRLEEYIIRKPLGGGGFSFVYLGEHLPSGQQVVIKEFFPHRLAARQDDLTVVPRCAEDAGRLQSGRTLFLQEADILARLRHPNIVHVTGFLRLNGTVYMIMNWEGGANLQHYIARHKGGLSERFLLTVFPPLLDALQALHDAGYLHQDVKPGNIHLRQGGNPLLLDFGAAHRRMVSRLFAQGLITSPGYTPIEQYARNGYVGPWTDVYAMGATMRSCIEGKPPQDAREREQRDRLRPAAQAFRRRYSPDLLCLIDWAMEMDPLERPQTARELQEALSQLTREPEQNPTAAAPGS